MNNVVCSCYPVKVCAHLSTSSHEQSSFIC